MRRAHRSYNCYISARAGIPRRSPSQEITTVRCAASGGGEPTRRAGSPYDTVAEYDQISTHARGRFQAPGQRRDRRQ